MVFAVIWFFFSALNAWVDGDDSGKWIVIIGVAFLAFAWIASLVN